jgi:hypothetical protein
VLSDAATLITAAKSAAYPRPHNDGRFTGLVWESKDRWVVLYNKAIESRDADCPPDLVRFEVKLLTVRAFQRLLPDDEREKGRRVSVGEALTVRFASLALGRAFDDLRLGVGVAEPTADPLDILMAKYPPQRARTLAAVHDRLALRGHRTARRTWGTRQYQKYRQALVDAGISLPVGREEGGTEDGDVAPMLPRPTYEFLASRPPLRPVAR